MKPTVSVIMPFYNAGKYLDNSIGSILSQTFKDFELIIINDASVDDSDRIVKKYLSDSRVKYIKNDSNVGIVENLNKALSVSSGELIARMDGDDISEITRLEKQVDFLTKHPEVGIVGAFAEVIDEDGNSSGRIIKKPTKPSEIKKYLFQFLTIIHGTAMIRRDVYKKFGKYNNKYLFSEDIDFTYRIIYGGIVGANIPEVLYKYRYHTTSTAHKSKSAAFRLLKLRKDAVLQHKIETTFPDIFLMYAQFIVGIIFSGRQRQIIEKIYKRIFHSE